MLLDVREHLVVAQPESLLHHLDDSQIRLMGHEQLDVGGGEAVGLERELDRLRHLHRRELEYVAPFPVRQMEPLAEHLLAPQPIARPPRPLPPPTLTVPPAPHS